jgi:ribosomal protein L31E
MQEKKVIVGIDVRGKNFKHKAKHGMTELRRQILKHFRSNDYVISKNLNEYFFAKGRANVPTKVSIIGVEKNKKLYIFLDSPEDVKNIEKLNEKKVEAKKEVKKEEPKTEEVKEPKETKEKVVKESKSKK